LTAVPGPTIVKIEHPTYKMRRIARKRKLHTLPKWQIGVCLLLAALVLYNPYLAARDSAAGLCLRHAASNRATVGASELQHFTPANPRGILATADAVSPQQFPPIALHAICAHVLILEEILVPVQLFCSSLWFRPPPSV
jgi:hypothetical protein